MSVVDGKEIAEELLQKLKRRPVPKKFLAGVLIGGNPASESFQKLKEKTARALGIDYRIYHLPESGSNDDLREKVGEIAAHKTCGGVLVQLPLPENLNKQYILNAIPKEKDVDVLGERAMGSFYAKRSRVLPPAVATTAEILKRTGFFTEDQVLFGRSPKDATVVVVGPGFLIGRPVALWLISRATRIVILDKGSDHALLKEADLVISGAGVAGLIQPEMLKPGAGVIDFGYSSYQGPWNMKHEAGAEYDADSKKLHGDFDYSSLKPKTSNLEPAFYTPTPGGTGPILVAKLIENFYALNTEN